MRNYTKFLAFFVISLSLFVSCCAVIQEDSPKLLIAPTPSNEVRQIVLISDFHIGVGRVEKDEKTGRWTKGPWHPTEDFRWHEEFEEFLKKIQKYAEMDNVSTDLIIVGDFFELWQSAGHKCGIEGKRNLGCNEKQALVRLHRVLGAHHRLMKTLGEFASNLQFQNKIVFIPGNHDAALVFNKVAKEIIKAIPATSGRIMIIQEGYWLSADGQIFVEHGHQMEGDVNEFGDWNRPAYCFDKLENRIDCNSLEKTAYLQRTWGENFVQSFYNRYEEEFSAIDNLSSETLGVRLGMAAFNYSEILDTLAKGFKFLLLQQTAAQAIQGLGKEDDEGKPPQWDLKATRSKDIQFFVESFPQDDPIRNKVEKLLLEGKQEFDPSKLSNHEINIICDTRSTLINNQKLKGGIQPCPNLKGDPKSLRAFATALVRSEKEILSDHLVRRYDSIPDELKPKVPFGNFVYGHTHKAKTYERFFEKEEWRKSKVFNTGAWQRVANPDQLQKIQKKMKLPDDKALLRLNPEDLPPCYSFVRIPPYNISLGEKPEPYLAYWVQSPEGNGWKVLSKCSY